MINLSYFIRFSFIKFNKRRDIYVNISRVFIFFSRVLTSSINRIEIVGSRGKKRACVLHLGGRKYFFVVTFAAPRRALEILYDANTCGP